MGDFLFSIDKALFSFINITLANPLFDVVMPGFTDWHQTWIGRGIFLVLWLLLLWKGGKKGRVAGLLLIPLIIIGDQFSSFVLKPLVARARPCHVINGARVIEHIRLLVDCGPGYSFPSTHAVNNFAVAAFFSYYYREWKWLLFFYAFMMALSRVIVGVHYPSDAFGGAIVGVACAYVVILIWNYMTRKFPMLTISSEP